METPTKKAGPDQTTFTFALLDKHRLSDFNEIIRDSDANADEAFTLVKPFLRQRFHDSHEHVTIRRGPRNETGTNDYYLVNYQTMRKLPTAERIVNFFTGTPNKEDFDVSCTAAAILFPLEENPSLALVCLLGHWVTLINRECIVINFGVATAASQGIARVGKEGDVTGVKSAATTTTRDEISTKNWSKNRASLGQLGELKCLTTNSILTELTLKPNPIFGNKLIKGKDVFWLNLKLPTDNCEVTNYAFYLRNEAIKLYNIYLKGPIVKELLIYIDSPVTPQISQELFNVLDSKWSKFIQEKRINYHEVIWGMLLNGHGSDDYVKEILSLVDAGKSSKVIRIGRDKTKIANLITMQCMYLDTPGTNRKSYYRLERGTWYEMDESKLKHIKEDLKENHRIYSTELDLPMAFSDKSEEIYNETSVKEINEKSGKFVATLLDKKLVHTSGKNKFELADILLQEKGRPRSQQYLIHVKKASADALDHHCNQVLRAAQYMSQNFDRTAVAKCFGKCLDTKIYGKYIDILPNKKFSGFQKQKMVPKSHKSFMEMLNSYITAEGSKMTEQVKEIKEVICNLKELEKNYEMIIKHENAVLVWLDCIVDYVAAPKDPNISKAEVIKECLELLLEWLNRNEIFMKYTQGILMPKSKRSITLVLAIITDKDSEDYLIDNKVILIDNVITAVKGFGFKCKLTFILENGNQEKNNKRKRKKMK